MFRTASSSESEAHQFGEWRGDAVWPGAEVLASVGIPHLQDVGENAWMTQPKHLHAILSARQRLLLELGHQCLPSCLGLATFTYVTLAFYPAAFLNVRYAHLSLNQGASDLRT